MSRLDEIENAYNGGELWVLGTLPQLIAALRAAEDLIREHVRRCEHEFMDAEEVYFKAAREL